MRSLQKLSAATGFARVRGLAARVPVAVRINVNNECHCHCNYCSFWSTPTDEMDTETLCRVIRELSAAGTRRLSLSGGEPMLRDDIGSVVACAADAGISVSMNTTGYRFAERTEALRRLDLAKLSLDGSEDVHDRVRGRKGAFAELLEGIEVCRQVGARFAFAFTMTAQTLDDVPFAAEMARQHGTFVAFQPVMAVNHTHRNAEARFPDRARFVQTVDWLIERKQRGDGAIRNSLGGLRHIRRWPAFDGRLRCFAGRAFAMVEANGDLVPCDRLRYTDPLPNLRRTSVADALRQLPEVHCPGCGYVGSLEINRLLNLQPGAGRAILRVVRGL